MRFFDREDKIERLRQIRARSVSEAQFTVITGRRRVGKTELVQHAFADGDFGQSAREVRGLRPSGGTRQEATEVCRPVAGGHVGETRKIPLIIIARNERISGKKAEYRDMQGSGVMLTIPVFSDDLLANSSENEVVSSENGVDSSESAGSSSEKMMVGKQVLTMIAADSSVTQVAIAKKLHCPRSTVAYWFKKFSDEGKIVRKGPDKGGRWLVNALSTSAPPTT